MSEASEVRIEVVKVPKRIFVGVRRRVPAAGIGAACGDILPRVAQWLGQKGIGIAGPPTTIYHAHDEEKGEFDLQPGFFVTAAPAVEGDIGVVETPEMEAVRVVHVGPYDQLGAAWGQVGAWFGREGRKPGEPCWESYLNDPGETPPEALQTEIIWAIGD